jgi:hypothetical protein
MSYYPDRRFLPWRLAQPRHGSSPHSEAAAPQASRHGCSGAEPHVGSRGRLPIPLPLKPQLGAADPIPALAAFASA